MVHETWVALQIVPAGFYEWLNVLINSSSLDQRMVSQTNDNIVPLVEAVVARRNRLIARELQSSVADFVTIKDTTEQIDRWLIEFAYKRIVRDY